MTASASRIGYGFVFLFLLFSSPNLLFGQDEAEFEKLIAAYATARHHAPDQSRRLVMQIATRGGSVAAEWMLRRYEEEGDSGHRAWLLRGMAELSGEEGIAGAFRRAARGDDGEREQLGAIYYLHRFDFDWRTLLVEVAAASSRETVVQACAKALAAPGDPLGLVFLKRCLRQLPEPGQGASVIFAAGENYPLASIDQTFTAPFLNAEANSALRLAALEVLGHSQPAKMFAAIESIRTVEGRVIEAAERAAWIRLTSRLIPERALEVILPCLVPVDPECAEAFLEAAAGLQHEEARLWFRKEGLRHEDPQVRRAAVHHLIAAKRVKDLKLLKAAAGDEDLSVRMAVIEAFARRPYEASREFLLRSSRAKNIHEAAAAVAGLGRHGLGREEVFEALLDIASKSKRWELRIEAMETLASGDVRRVEGMLRTNARYANPFVRIAAYRQLARIRRHATVDFLIERLGRDKGRPQDAVEAALADLTNFRWGKNANKWSSWWRKVKAEFPIAAEQKSHRNGRRSDGRYANFYGIAVDSGRVAFVIDVSRSMSHLAPNHRVSRLVRMQKELRRALKHRPSHTFFALISFANDVAIHKGGLQALKASNRRRADRWIDYLKADGGTNLYGGLMAALKMEDVDTIFLLTDGAPSVGEVVDKNAILETVRSFNRYRRITIHTIGVGLQEQERTFLQRLAEENRGRSVLEN